MPPSCLPNGNASLLFREHLSTPHGKKLCGYIGPENKVNMNPTVKLITLSSLKFPRNVLSIKYTFSACQGSSISSRSNVSNSTKYKKKILLKKNTRHARSYLVIIYIKNHQTIHRYKDTVRHFCPHLFGCILLTT